MLTAEAVWEMPPFKGWYTGNVNIGELIDPRARAASTTCR